jgi:hypothetical protein
MPHGPVMAALMVMMAVALQMAKPLARIRHEG